MLREDYLGSLALKYGSDKHGHHDYCRHYQKHFEPQKDKPIVFLELGVGGYEFPDRGGAGLWMWATFFNQAKIYGIDLHDKSGIKLPPRTKLFQGSQDNFPFLQNVLDEIGTPDIIIDDASHINELTNKTFTYLFPRLKSGGIYVIEDLESSWWEDHGFGGCADHNNYLHNSTVNFLRKCINDVNSKHLPAGAQIFDIDSIHFYQNMAVILKR